MADAYMMGHSVADIMTRGILAAKANAQVILQLTGGTLMKAMTLHLAAVLPSASGHSINLDDQYEEDITTERIPVSEGLSRVPEAPGLGIDVDEEMLKKVAANKQILGNRPRVIGILKLPGGTTYHTPRNPNPRIITGRGRGNDSWHRLRPLGGRRQRGVRGGVSEDEGRVGGEGSEGH